MARKFRLTLKTRAFSAFPAPIGCAIIRGRTGATRPGPGHTAIPFRQARGMAAVWIIFQSDQYLRRIHTAIPRKIALSTCARVRARVHAPAPEEVCISLVWRYGKKEVIEKVDEKAIPQPYRAQIAAVWRYGWRLVGRGASWLSDWKGSKRGEFAHART